MPCPFCKRPSASSSSNLCGDALMGRNCIDLTRAAQAPINFKRDQLVYFGRRQGEKTLGEVVKVNAKSIKVRQLEARGTMKDHRVGTLWNVARSLVEPAPEGTARPDVPKTEPVRRPRQPRGFPFMGTLDQLKAHLQENKRPEPEIIREILGVYAALSPENLTCDGELSQVQVIKRSRALHVQLEALFREIGRRVSETEAYQAARAH